jgi:hypothetical protein
MVGLELLQREGRLLGLELSFLKRLIGSEIPFTQCGTCQVY